MSIFDRHFRLFFSEAYHQLILMHYNGSLHQIVPPFVQILVPILLSSIDQLLLSLMTLSPMQESERLFRKLSF